MKNFSYQSGRMHGHGNTFRNANTRHIARHQSTGYEKSRKLSSDRLQIPITHQVSLRQERNIEAPIDLTQFDSSSCDSRSEYQKPHPESKLLLPCDASVCSNQNSELQHDNKLYDIDYDSLLVFGEELDDVSLTPGPSKEAFEVDNRSLSPLSSAKSDKSDVGHSQNINTVTPEDLNKKSHRRNVQFKRDRDQHISQESHMVTTNVLCDVSDPGSNVDPSFNGNDLKKMRFDTDMEDSKIVSEVVDELNDAGLFTHWIGDLGYKRSKDDAKTGVTRVARCLAYTYAHVNDGKRLPRIEILQWFRELVFEYYAVLQEFCTLKLATEMHLQPSGIQAYLNDIKKSAKWLVCHYRLRKQLLNQHQRNLSEGFNDVTSALGKVYARAKKKEYAKLKTLDRYVHDLKIPPEGLKKLREVVEAKLPWVNSLIKQTDISEHDYRLFLQLLCASIYVFSPNGRQLAISRLTYKDGRRLIRHGYTESDQFKTAFKYRLQPVLVEGISRHLLQVYINNIRINSLRGTHPKDEDPLFIRFDGTTAAVGKLVTAFFEKEINNSVCVTAIRTLVNTAMTDAFSNEEINRNELQSIQQINGHSSKIAQDHYHLHKARDEAICGQGAFSKIFRGQRNYGNQNELTNHEQSNRKNSNGLIRRGHAEHANAKRLDCEINYAWDMDELSLVDPPAKEWGEEHTDRHKNCRATWTRAEIEYINDWIVNHDHIRQQRVAMCLKDIKQDSNAYPIFHPCHVLKSDRLRYGFIAHAKWLDQKQMKGVGMC